MEKLNALFKSHRPRLTSGMTLAIQDPLKVKEARNGTKPKSAPCTPCVNHDIFFDVDASGNLNDAAARQKQVNSADSMTKLNRSVHCTPHAGVTVQQHSLDRQRHRSTAVGCSPVELSSQLHRNHADADDVHLVAHEYSRRQRRHRTRERHRSTNRIANGLDRSWEAHRIEGMEMLQHSVEVLKERQGRRQPSLPDRTTHAVTRDRSKSRSDGIRCHNQVAEPFNLPDVRVCVERRLIELSRQLLEERQRSRQDRLNLAKLQQELARQKSEHPLREVLMKELERERLLRIEAENRLRDERLDVCDCKSQATELQKELARAQEFARSLIPYKSKYEHLKEENANAEMNYESQMEALQTDVSQLTEERNSLLADLSLLQKTCAGCRQCAAQSADSRLSVSGTSHSDESMGSSSSEKTKVLLERMKMLETEKTCLVLENERQCEQYEQCLDDITSQVLQAVMAQRSLKVQCCKLRAQVIEIQQQNDELRRLFCDGARNQLSNDDVTALMNLQEKRSTKMRTESESLTSDMAVSFESLRSMCSDREQMQFLVSRLASPTIIDFGDDGRNDTLSIDDETMPPELLLSSALPSSGLQQQQQVCAEKSCCNSLSENTQKCTEHQPDCTERFCHTSVSSVRQPQDCAQKLVLTGMPSDTRQQDSISQQPDCADMSRLASVPPTAQQQDCTDQQQQPASANRLCQSSVGQQLDFAGKSSCATVPSDTESTMSLNELLDSCQCDIDASETYAIDSYDVDDCMQPALSQQCEIVNILRVSIDPDATHNHSIPKMSESSLRRLAVNSQPGKHVCNGDESRRQSEGVSVLSNDEVQSSCQMAASPLMQRSFAESNMSSSSLSSEKVHVDDGYHSNAMSAMSQEPAVSDDKSGVLVAVQPLSM